MNDKINNKSDEKKENQRIIDSYDYLSNAATPWDCTGLIPWLPTSEAELESYQDVYHYQPPRVPSKDPENDL